MRRGGKGLAAVFSSLAGDRILDGVQGEPELILQGLEPLAHVAQLEARHLVQFFFRRLPPLLELHLSHGLIQYADALPERAGEPVEPAQFVQHGSPDAGLGIGLEPDAELGAELAQGFHESQRAGADHLVQFHAPRQLDLEAQRKEADLGGIMPHDGFLLRRGEILPGSGAGLKSLPGGGLVCSCCPGMHAFPLRPTCQVMGGLVREPPFSKTAAFSRRT